MTANASTIRPEGFPPRHQPPFDLIVIGGGTAGITAVDEALIRFDAAGRRDARIALVEKHQLGGECAHYACVPTKTMLTAAKQLKTLTRLCGEYGVMAESIRFDFARLMAKKEAVIREGGYPVLDDPRVSLFHGGAAFVSPDTVEVDGQLLEGRRIIIATGARPAVPAIDGLDKVDFLVFRDATALTELPESLIILGGGAVGVEFAYMFSIFGVEVTLIEHGPRLLKREEPEISRALRANLEHHGVQVYTNCRVEHVEQTDRIKKVVFKDNGELMSLNAMELLVATGTRPDYGGLNLEAAGVALGDRGVIRVDEYLRTGNPLVYAIGDAVGPYRFTHTADYQAEIAVRHALGIPTAGVDYHAVPWAVFTEPTVGHAGITEEQARKQFEPVVTLMADASEVSRYRIESQEEGLIKLVVHGGNHRLLGGHVFAVQGEEIAQMIALAIQHQMTVPELLSVIYIYPARSQLLQKALEKYPVTAYQKQPAGLPA